MLTLSRLLSLLLLSVVLLGGTAAVAQPIPLTLPDTSGTVGQTITVPLTVDADLSGRGVMAYEIALNFRGTILRVEEVTTTNTLSAAFGTVQYSVERAGQYNATLRIAGAGTSPLAGAGPLVNVVFALAESGTASLSFDSDLTFVNEGTPALDLSDSGRVSVAARPVISVSPNTAQVLRGDTRQFAVSGGTEPYTWSVTEEAVAKINAEGLLTALAPGQTRVVAVDDAGIRDTSDVIQTIGFQLSLPDTSARVGTAIDVPIRTTDLTGLGVTAGQFRLRGLGADRLTLNGTKTTGTLLEGREILLNEGADGLNVAFAGETELSGAGVLLSLTIYIQKDASGRTGLALEEVLFNETLPGFGEGGQVRGDALPALSISPRSGTLLAGETVDLSVQNATGPLTWTVSNSTLATISAAGRLTALQGGEVTVTATDSIGATVTTDEFSIDDVTLAFPDTSVRPNATIRLPLRIGNLPAAVNPSAIELTVQYPSSLLSVTGGEGTGTGTEGWSYSFSDDSGVVTIAGAGTAPVDASGDFLMLVLETATLTAEQTATLRIEALTLNEGRPIARVDASSQVRITQENRAPGFTALPGTRLTMNDAYTGTVSVQDPDGDAVTITAAQSPDWLTLSDQGDGTATLSGTPSAVGFYGLTLSADDGQLQTDRSLSLAVYTSTRTVRLSAGDPDPQLFSSIGLEVDVSALGSDTDLFVGEQTEPQPDGLTLPQGQGLAVKRLWTLEAAVGTGFATTVCFDVTTLVNDVSPSAIAVRMRQNPSDAWSTPLSTELRPAGAPTQICAIDVRSPGSFVVTAALADLPVELVGFSARAVHNTVVLQWATASETNNAGFHLERAVDDGSFARLRFVSGHGTTDRTRRYRIVDRQLPFHAQRVTYRLRQEDLDGQEALGSEVAVQVGVPSALQLHETFPNPARGAVTVRYELPEAGPVRLAVYNLLGQRVRVLVDDAQRAGRAEHVLNAALLPTGTYFLRLSTPHGHRTQRLTVVH